MNQGELIQLTLSNETDVVTVITVPAAAVAGLGETATLTFGTATLVAYSCTAVSTADVCEPVVLAMRAPTREALISTCCTISARPISIKPITIRKNTGATIANSAAAAPRRRSFLVDRR